LAVVHIVICVHSRNVTNTIACRKARAIGRRVRRRVAGVSVVARRYRVIDVRVGVITRICIGVRIVRRTGVDVVYQASVVRGVYISVRVGRVSRCVDGRVIGISVYRRAGVRRIVRVAIVIIVSISRRTRTSRSRSYFSLRLSKHKHWQCLQ